MYCDKYGPTVKKNQNVLFRMELGFTGCPLETPPGADGILTLII